MIHVAAKRSRFASDFTNSNPQVIEIASLADLRFRFFHHFLIRYLLFYGKLDGFPHVDKPVDVWITTLLWGINNRLWG